MIEIKFRLLNKKKIVGYEKWYPGAWEKDECRPGYWVAEPRWLYSDDNEKWGPVPWFKYDHKEQLTGFHAEKQIAALKEESMTDSLSCKTCGHYYLMEMVTSGPYSYSGDIPCLRCSRFQRANDEHTAIVVNGLTWTDKSGLTAD